MNNYPENDYVQNITQIKYLPFFFFCPFFLHFFLSSPIQIPSRRGQNPQRVKIFMRYSEVFLIDGGAIRGAFQQEDKEEKVGTFTIMRYSEGCAVSGGAIGGANCSMTHRNNNFFGPLHLITPVKLSPE